VEEEKRRGKKKKEERRDYIKSERGGEGERGTDCELRPF
jgi:hypothetical protein